MLKSHIESILVDNLGHTPTADQSEAISGLSAYVLENNNDNIFVLTGYAGTGKTTLIKALVRTLESFRFRSVLLAPTGRAAKVLASYSGKEAFTIHKHIYRQRGSKDGMGRFELDRNLLKEAFFIVDESSMISNNSSEQSVFGSGRLLDDLVEFVYSGRDCKLILVGDTAQLPPVGSDISPALDASVLGSYGFGVQNAILRKVVRQAEESGILMNATGIRMMVEEGSPDLPKFRLEGFSDIKRISGEFLLEELESSYSFAGSDGTIVVVNSNRLANKYNQGIRNRILYREEDISSGDRVMIVKNNYYWTEDDENIDFIANGDIAVIKKIVSREERYGYKYADMILEFGDYNTELEVKVILDTLWTDKASLGYDENRELFQNVQADYIHLKTRKKQYDAVKKDPFFNAMQIKFAYAVTCHKAQGGQWERVFFDQGMFNAQEPTIDYLRWLYTAVTRSTDKLYLVNYSGKFFD
ncbi:MAG: AAA family ATPase [Marinilabiliaceae bacterium]|jgi:exodeoxyribonuclease-5|nr:AAA family ATPase [Marinilabiliaceae bacterium]